MTDDATVDAEGYGPGEHPADGDPTEMVQVDPTHVVPRAYMTPDERAAEVAQRGAEVAAQLSDQLPEGVEVRFDNRPMQVTPDPRAAERAEVDATDYSVADLTAGVDVPTEAVELDPTAAHPPVPDSLSDRLAELPDFTIGADDRPEDPDAPHGAHLPPADSPVYEDGIDVFRNDGGRLVHLGREPADDADLHLDQGYVIRWSDGSTSVPAGYDGPLLPAQEPAAFGKVLDVLADRLPDPTAPTADVPAVDPEMELGAFTGAMCRAVGLDPEQVAGFRLTVQGGAYPQLEVWHLPPLGPNGEMTERWPRAIAERMADTTIAVLPGSGGTLPPTGPRTGHLLPGHEVPPELADDHWIAAHLPMILDVLNGAPVDGDTRDQLTALGHHIAQDKARLVGSAQRPAQRPQAPDGGTTGG